MGQATGRRSYDASGRRARAAENRARVLAVARDLLLTEGFAEFSVSRVAAAAEVSAELVYKAVGGRAALLATLLDVAIGGDDEPVALAEREAIMALRSLTDAREVLHGYTAVAVAVQERTAPLLLLALRSTGDTGAAALLAKADGERLAGMTGLARHLLGTGQTRPDMDLEALRDALWALNGIQLWDQLVVQRGWTPARYGEVLERLFVAAVLA
ncbi:transcriptional regulator, TetR family [Quadrisphaera granulorum]|uniref:TetR family transcriptional regulator n=1 Tax=Quadrisphaera granulorum TaxID=317664 RepID=A0A316B0Z8_9ACTN|nr:TetR family transcriptional regulator [Quadrisphaera granulorum]PWJ56167.1 TetR family transcriptional regulator [Quadrisphaera granulorum]SZE94801.1 transcriptional regulator, TetR family [Quadrisphaera granulorum]